jgi:hypothetical protein
MFSRGFGDQIIAPSASGQPGFVRDPVLWNAHLIAAHPVLADGTFAAIQIAIGIGFLYRRTSRVAIVVSIFWAVGVWYLGEGLSGLASGQTTGLVGAPGAALLYAILALAAWPAEESFPSGRFSIIRKVAVVREGGQNGDLPRWVLWAWSFIWVGYAVLDLLPQNDSASAVHGTLVSSASGVPHWLAVVDRSLAGGAHALGGWTNVLFVIVELSVGLLVLARGRRPLLGLSLGLLVAALFWATGQSFGDLLSGQATDPDTGLLLILLGLAGLGALKAGSRSGVSAEMSPGTDRIAA